MNNDAAETLRVELLCFLCIPQMRGLHVRITAALHCLPSFSHYFEHRDLTSGLGMFIEVSWTASDASDLKRQVQLKHRHELRLGHSHRFAYQPLDTLSSQRISLLLIIVPTSYLTE